MRIAVRVARVIAALAGDGTTDDARVATKTTPGAGKGKPAPGAGTPGGGAATPCAPRPPAEANR